MPLIIDQLSIQLLSFDSSPDLILFLIQPPNVLNRRLLSLPRLNVKDGPERNEQNIGVIHGGVHVAQVRDQKRLIVFLVSGAEHQVINEKYSTENGWYQLPPDMVQEKGQEHGILLTVVVCDEVDRLEVFHEGFAHGEHVPDQTQAVLLNTLNNFVLFARVWHKMVFNHTPIDQSFHVELLLENGANKSILFSRPESLVLGAPCIPEHQCLVPVLQLYPQLLPFSLFVEYLVVEKDEHDHFRFREEGVLEDPIVLAKLSQF